MLFRLWVRIDTPSSLAAGLPAEVLADMVMANMSQLPQREDVAPAAGHQQAVGVGAGLSGLVQVHE